ncbi:hypothetical protein PT281_01625 [Lactobacillus sp. ESL0701]|uniref:hypothetical protein n=1 Tax=Lactobacillus sp. ESL0701 TaxID=2983217 RepID=UPI0023FA0B3A|nr:hypothetical protein [Lactobacillus sp. ESL0701]MDF7671986.1 hypothetical protein [Lactobacillus sp. ESL0701]
MTVFNHLFKELFKQKNRNANAVIIIQLISALAITIISFVAEGRYEAEDWKMVLPMFAILFAVTSIIALPIYLVVTCYKNEHVNRSQTWRLAPISDEMFYLDNTLSSFISVIYLLIVQIVVIAILTGISFVLFNENLNDAFKGLMNGLSGTNYNVAFGNILQVICLTILISLFTYLIVSFLNFSTRAIVDYLPGISSKAAVTILRLVLIIVIAKLLEKIFELFSNVILSPTNYLFGNMNITLNGIIFIFLVIDIVLLLANMLLINKFFEAEPNK